MARREGVWRSPGYRSARRRAQATQVCLALVLFALAVALALDVVEAGIGAMVFNGGRETEQDVRSLVDNVNLAANWFAILATATAVCFLAWLSRSVDNAPPLAAGTPERGPRESIAWWLVPGLDLFMPAVIVADLYARLGVQRRSGRDAVVMAWWVATAGGLVLALLAYGMRPDLQPDVAAAAQSQGVAGTAADLVCLVAAVLGLWLVAEIQGRADLRATTLGLEVASPSGAAVATPGGATPGGTFVWPEWVSGGATSPLAPLVPRPKPGSQVPWEPAPGRIDAGGSGSPDASDAGDTIEAHPPGSGDSRPTETVLYCPRCGRRRTAAGRFCAGCGLDLGNP